MWKSFVEVLGLAFGFLIFIGFFLGLNKASHHFTRPEMNFWTYIAFPVGAVIPWFVTIAILLLIFPGGTDPSTGQTGFLPLAGYAAIFAIPIYVVASVIGSFAFLTGATILSRLFAGAGITSSLIVLLAITIFTLNKAGRL